MKYKKLLECDLSSYKIAGIRVKRRFGCSRKVVSLDVKVLK